jgi:hypothetical protein
MRWLRVASVSSILAGCIAVTAPASAQESSTVAPAASFGAPGQWVLGGATSLGVSHDSHSDTSLSAFEVAGSLGVDLFVARNVSLGLDLGAGYSSAHTYVAGATGSFDRNTAWVSLGPRVGFHVPLGDRFSFYPRLGAGIAWRRDFVPLVIVDPGAGTVVDSNFPSDGFARSSIGPWASLYAPVLYHLGPRFFVGFGPRVYASFADDPTPQVEHPRVQAGLALEVGGTWGGEPEAPATEPPRDEPVVERYGTQGSVVLTNALGLSAQVSTYTTSSALTSFDVSPSFDYFVASNVSLGVGATFSHAGRSDGYHDDVYEAAPRVGFAVPLGRHVTLHPKLSIGAGSRSSSSSTAEQESRTYVWGGLSAPVLVDVAPHFFVGFGPVLVQEIFRKYERGYSGERLTRIAADGVLGGWF